jgi:hypothetical protein
MPTYTGLTARICGTALGSLLATIGLGACLYFVTMFGLIPPMVQQIVVDITPMTNGMAGPTPRRTVPLAIFVVLSLATAVVGCYGLLEIGEAIFSKEYSIELTMGEGGHGGIE